VLSRRPTAEPLDDDEPDEDALAALGDSFHSEGGRVRRKHVGWSRERYADRTASLGRVRSPAFAFTAPSGGAEGGGEPHERGRPPSREDDEAQATAQRRSSRAGRRSASIVFLSAWALFGVGTLAGSQTDFARRALGMTGVREGRVLGASEAAWAAPTGAPVAAATVVPSAQAFASSSPIPVTVPVPSPPTPSYRTAQEEPSMERLIGRISAWICTTLYLTSRLPQIWKNVSGLSPARA
jgi:hypothetical protein